MKKLLILFITAVLLSHTAVFLCRADASPPSLSAQSAILIEERSGLTLFERNAKARMGMASTTKIMTALTALSLCELDDVVTVSDKAVGIEGSSIYLCAEERLTVEELLYATLLSSANDAAAALAIYCCDSVEAFSEEMNRLARELGAYDTHFVNPHGLDHEEHYTTAYDLALITRAALGDDRLAKIFATYKKSLPFDGEPNKRLAVNHNKLLKSYEGAIGVKTGFTKKTGRCLVSAATRDGMTLIAVTLNAPDDWRDHTAMLDYGFENFERRVLFDTGEFLYSFPVSGGVADTVTLSNTQPIALTLRKEQPSPEASVLSHLRFVTAPVSRGRVIGSVCVTASNETCASPLAAVDEVSSRDSVKQKGLFQRIAELFK